jgi:hypothetical protein
LKNAVLEPEDKIRRRNKVEGRWPVAVRVQYGETEKSLFSEFFKALSDHHLCMDKSEAL